MDTNILSCVICKKSGKNWNGVVLVRSAEGQFDSFLQPDEYLLIHSEIFYSTLR